MERAAEHRAWLTRSAAVASIAMALTLAALKGWAAWRTGCPCDCRLVCVEDALRAGAFALGSLPPSLLRKSPNEDDDLDFA